MAISRFQSSFKVRTDLMDNITPNNVVQREVSTPAGEWKPAAWLPVVWQNEKSKDYFTISSGKVVSFDASGRIVPSGLLRKCLAAAFGDTVISYSANDVAARVIDITTGKFVTGAKNVTLQGFANAIRLNGWSTAAAPGDAAAANVIVKAFISAPVGVAAYDVYCWAGDDPANLHFTNYQKQHLIQFFTDIQMRVPHVCKSAADVSLIDLGAGAARARIDGSTLASDYPRYAGIDMSNVVAYPAASAFASNTSRTPISPLQSAAGVNWVGRERSEIALLAKDGDYFLDGDAGLVLFYEAGGNGLPKDATLDANGAAAPENLATGGSAFGYGGAESQQARMIHLVGAAKPGDVVTFDTESNFVVLGDLDLSIAGAAAATGALDGNAAGAGAGDALVIDASINAAVNALRDAFETALEDRHFEESLVVGRVLELIKEPRGLLERVRTGFQGDEFAADAKMPGSATGGFSDLITLSDEVVADEIAVINIKVQ